MKYSIIYADPPWRMKEPHQEYGAPYGTMSDEEIINLPINQLTDKNCVLFLWVISSKIDVAMKVCEAWGFDYKTVGFNWIKTSKKTGMPNCRLASYTLSATEICLLAMKGRVPKKSFKVKQVFMHPREKHSKKPDEIRNRIVELFGDLPRVELFAREQNDGWDVFGNEVENSIKIEED
jgi:site-specific DNA-methyltransferase (adenine-specific)